MSAVRLLSDLLRTGPGLVLSSPVGSGLLSNAFVLSETFPVGTMFVSTFFKSSFSSSIEINVIF